MVLWLTHSANTWTSPISRPGRDTNPWEISVRKGMRRKKNLCQIKHAAPSAVASPREQRSSRKNKNNPHTELSLESLEAIVFSMAASGSEISSCQCDFLLTLNLKICKSSNERLISYFLLTASITLSWIYSQIRAAKSLAWQDDRLLKRFPTSKKARPCDFCLHASVWL